jgi:hypothetical protein
MITTELSLIDIKISKEHDYLLDQIENDALTNYHRNSKNYVNIRNSLDNFLSYELLIDKQHNVIASSGLQKYSDGQARLASRTYTMSAYRKNSGASLPVSENIFVPYEIDVAKKHHQRIVFFSIELLRRRNAVNRFCKNLNNNGLNFKIHPNMINTCRRYISNGVETVNQEQSCWQNVAYLSFDDSELTLPSIEVSEYHSKYYISELSRLTHARSK